MDVGKSGEEMALGFFRKRGYDILECNWRFSYYEIDLVVSRERILHFVEVKARVSDRFGSPESAVTPRKMERLMKAAGHYMAKNPRWKKVQFDVLAIRLLKGQSPEFRLFEDVYA